MKTKEQLEKILLNWTSFVKYMKKTSAKDIDDLQELQTLEQNTGKRRSFLERIVPRKYELMKMVELKAIKRNYK